MPALLTRMSSRPWRATMAPGSGSTAAGSVTSRLTASARRPLAVSSATHVVRVVAARGGDHDRALRGEPPGDRAADAARRTGHERDFARQIEHGSARRLHPSAGSEWPRARSRRGSLDRRQIVRAAEADDRGLAVNLAHQSAQHGARTHLNIRCDALRRKARDDGFPADRRRHLRTSASIAARASRFGSASTLATIGTRGRVRRQRAQLGRQAVLGRLHQRAVERRAHRQRHDAPGAERLGPLARARDRVARAGNHHLPGAVQVRRAHDLALGGLGARLRDLFGVEAEDRRHRAVADRHRLLHVAAAAPHDPQRVGEREGAGRDVGRVLAEAVAGDERGREPARREQAVGGDADRQDRRLRVLGQRQLVLGAVEEEAAQRLAERRVGLVERLAADRKRVGQRLAHADLLRSLSGKDEGDHGWDTAAAAMSRSTRSMKRSAAKRYAIATALRTALRARSAVADDGDAGDAEQRRAAVFGVVDAAAEMPQRAARQQRSDAHR